MTLERIVTPSWAARCDGCGRLHRVSDPNQARALEKAVDAGWSTTPMGARVHDLCPSCQEATS